MITPCRHYCRHSRFRQPKPGKSGSAAAAQCGALRCQHAALAFCYAAQQMLHAQQRRMMRAAPCAMRAQPLRRTRGLLFRHAHAAATLPPLAADDILPLFPDIMRCCLIFFRQHADVTPPRRRVAAFHFFHAMPLFCRYALIFFAPATPYATRAAMALCCAPARCVEDAPTAALICLRFLPMPPLRYAVTPHA